MKNTNLAPSFLIAESYNEKVGYRLSSRALNGALNRCRLNRKESKADELMHAVDSEALTNTETRS